MNEMSRPRGAATRQRSSDAPPDMDMGPSPEYGPPAPRDTPPAADAETRAIGEAMGGDRLVQVPAPPMLPAAVSAKVTERLTRVLAEVDWVKKRGDNRFHGYKYATIDELRDHVGRLCGKHGIAWRQDEIRAYPVGQRLIAVTYQFSLYASDEPQHEAFPSRVTVLASLVSGRGGFDDKAFSKARSLAWKDWAKSQFAIPTGDDPEPAHDEDPDGQREGGGPAEEERQEQRDPPQRRDARSRLDNIAEKSAGRGTRKPKGPAVPKCATPEEWADRFAAIAKDCRNADELDQLEANEQTNLEMLARDFPALRERCDAALRDMRVAMGA